MQRVEVVAAYSFFQATISSIRSTWTSPMPP